MIDRRTSYNVNELRGLACFLLVAYHVVGVPGSGMEVGDDSWYRYVTSSFEPVRMPLFTFISGLVYAYRPAGADRLAPFYGKKLRRLLIPFVTISTLFYLMQAVTPGAHGAYAPSEMWRIYVYSYAHFWYLQALFLIFLPVGLLDAFGITTRPLPFALLFAAALAAGMTLSVPDNPFSINEAMILLPHFLLGVAFTRFPALFRRPEVVGLTVAGLALSIGMHQMALFQHHALAWSDPVPMLCGMCGAMVLLRVMPSSAVFRRIGGHSYSIYLHHAFFTAGMRVVMHRLHLPDLAVFTAALAAGIAGPMLLEALASLRPITRVALVGKV